MTPTPRAAALALALALAALILPVWASIAALVVLLALTLADARAVARAPALEREVERVLSRGAPSPLHARALVRDRRSVALRQPGLSSLAIRSELSPSALSGEIVASRRGRFVLPGLASASIGPLGLGCHHHPAGASCELRVYPDLRPARRLVLALRHGASTADGRLRRGALGLGTEFESIRDYSPDDDIRSVNWRATERLGRPMSNRYRIEQDRDLVCLLDAGRLMAAPCQGGTLLDAALAALAAVALAADELGDRCGAIAFDRAVLRSLPPGRRGGRRTVEALYDLQPTLVDSDFEAAFIRVGATHRALVLVFTDLIDVAAARSLLDAMPMLARRHAVIVAGIGDEDLQARLEPSSAGVLDGYAMAAALSVLDARAAAAARLRRCGATVIEAPPQKLPDRCVQAYLRAKSRSRL
ncbi:MAG: DUF58 domain-containing protein [Solirubrobacteraceae bacterium]